MQPITHPADPATLLRAEHAAARVLAGAPEGGVLETDLLAAVGEALGWAAGSIWEPVPEEPNAVRCAATWSAPWFAGEGFRGVSLNTRLARGEGLPGQVLATGRSAWAAELPAHYPRARAALDAGLHSAFAVPLAASGGILGVLEFFAAQRREADEDLLATMTSLGGQIGQHLARRRAEDALRVGEARRRAVVDAAFDCVITMDATGHILDVNPATERTFGHPAAALVGAELAETLIPPDLREQHRRGLAHYLQTGEGHVVGRRCEMRALRADGTEFPVEVAIRRLDLPGPPVFTGYLRDVTEQRRAEQRLRVLVREQAALRRVATLVARGAGTREVCAAVVEEVGRLLDAQTAHMIRYRNDGAADVVGGWSLGTAGAVAVGEVVRLDGYTVASRIARSRRPERVASYEGLDGRLADQLRELGFRAAVGAPVVLEGNLWGAVIVSTLDPDPFPESAEQQIAGFTELVAHAIANAEAREQLAASRARIVTAGDAERRRLERNLHDGAQQRLVAVSLILRSAELRMAEDEPARAIVRSAGEELAHALAELRELARGLHPAVLTERGLGAAIDALAARASVPVEVSVTLQHRLPEATEAAAYFVVAESLANVAKHARGTAARVRIEEAGERLTVEIADDGIGGAQATGGSGLRGLVDRVEALGGQLGVVSRRGQGTVVRAELPREPAGI